MFIYDGVVEAARRDLQGESDTRTPPLPSSAVKGRPAILAPRAKVETQFHHQGNGPRIPHLGGIR